MSATKPSRLPVNEEHPVSDEGFPSEEEFTRVWNAITDVDEFGLTRLFKPIAQQLIDLYEDVEGAQPVTYEQVGVLSAHADLILEASEWLIGKARQLQELREELGDAAWNQEKADAAPKFSPSGGEYMPSKEALKRWELEGLVGSDAS